MDSNSIVEEEEINYEYSDSERSSSGSSASSSCSSSDEEDGISRRSGAPQSSSHSDGKAIERAHSQLHIARNEEAPVKHTTWGQSRLQEEGNAEAQEAQALPWIEKMQKQKGRVLQVARDRPPKLNADSIPYKLTLLWMSGMAPPENSRTIFECRVGISLFDESSGTFFGNTCQGVSRPWTAALPGPRGGPISSCQLEQDVFFHTRVVDPKCFLVVELIAVEKNIHGVVLAEYSVGWSTISLSAEARPTPPANLLPAYGLAREGAEVQLAWVKSGTPRYLMLRDLPHMSPPEQLPGCVLTYDLARYEPIAPAMSLLRENELVTDRELVPGILRVGAGGKPTRALRDAFSTIREPVVMPASKVLLSNLRLRLPPGFHQLLVTGSDSEAHDDAGAPSDDVAHMTGAMGREPRSMFQLRVTVHNGRRFTSYTMCTNRLRRIPGTDDLELADEMPMSGVYEDADVAIILELAFTGPLPWQTTHECDDCGPNGTCRICAQLAEPLPLAWAPFFPFDATWRVRDGAHSIQMRGGPGAWPRDHLILDWKGTLSKQFQSHVPSVSAEFNLQTLSRVGPNIDFSGDVHAQPETTYQEQYSVNSESASKQRAVKSAAPPEVSEHTRSSRTARDEQSKVPSHKQKPVPLRSRDSELSTPPHFASKPLKPQPSARSSSYTSTTQYAPELVEPPRAKVTSPEVLAERAARAAAEVAATKAAAAAAAGAGKRVREVEAMATAMQEQLRALTEAVTRIETVVTASKKSAPEESRREDLTLRKEKERQLRKEMGRKERRISAAVIIQKHVRRYLARRLLSDLKRAEASLRQVKQIPPTNYRRMSDPARFKGGVLEPTGSTQPSRALRAQIHKSGASEALPGEVRAVLGRTLSARSGADARAEPLDMGLELRDERSVNEVVVQFLAFTPGDRSRNGWPKSVYFTFQLYDFPPCTTDTVPLDSGARAPSEPVLLSGQNPSNLLYKYRVEEPSAVAHERRAHFCEYLRSKSLSVDVWDGDSLLQVGTVAVDLAGLLRQGREVSEILCDCQLEPPLDSGANMTSPIVSDASAARPKAHSASGKVLIRLINVGQFLEGKVGGSVNRRRSSLHSTDARRVGSVKVRVFPSTDLLTARTAGNSDAMKDEMGSFRGPSGGAGQRGDLESAQRRKEARRARLREILEEGNAKNTPGVNNLQGWKSLPAEKKRREIEGLGEEEKRVDVLHKTAPMRNGIGEMDYTARAETLREIEVSRTRKKAQVIQEKLRGSATRRRSIFPAYGELAFFEEEFRNPYSQEAVFRVECSDSEMQLVKDRKEWQHLRSLSKSNASSHVPEEDLFDKDGHLFLAPHESCRLAFKYQCNAFPDDFGERDASGSDVQDGKGAGNERRTRGTRTNGDLLEDGGPEGRERSVKISLVACKDNWPADVREVAVCFRPLVVDRTFRFYQAEHDFLKQTLPAPRGSRSSACARSSDSRVVVGISDEPSFNRDRPNRDSDGMKLESDGRHGGPAVYLKVKCGPAPETVHFYVTVYGDRYMGQLLATWRVFVHSLRRHDIGATFGQTTRSTLVVRGGHVTRHVACYCTDPLHLEIRPPELVLPAGSLTDLTLAYKPSGTERQSIRLHLVDTQSRQLVGAYMIAARTGTPVPSKMFEVEITAGTVAKKKISFTNPYPHAKIFYLSTSHPHLVSFRPADVLDLPPDGTRYIGLTVNGTAMSGREGARLEEVLIFVNDAEDKTEECLKVCIKIC